jgi:hypothetical protein
VPDNLPSGCHRGRPGQQQVNLGRTSFIYDESRFLLTAVDLPIVSWVAEATEEVPCLVLSVKLDMSMVRELLSREEIQVAEGPSDSPAMSIGETTPEFLNACCRLLDLLDSPQDIPFLSGLIQREIIYRVLRGPTGSRSREVATSAIKANGRQKQSHGSPRTMQSLYAWKNSQSLRAWAYPHCTITSAC